MSEQTDAIPSPDGGERRAPQKLTKYLAPYLCLDEGTNTTLGVEWVYLAADVDQALAEAAQARTDLLRERNDALEAESESADEVAALRGQLAEPTRTQRTDKKLLEAARAALVETIKERDRWFVECQRLATGLIDTFEERVDGDGDGELKPEQAVDVAFRLCDELLKTERKLTEAEQRADFQECEAMNLEKRLTEAEKDAQYCKDRHDFCAEVLEKREAELERLRTAVTAIAQELEARVIHDEDTTREDYSLTDDWDDGYTQALRWVAARLRDAMETK